MSTDTAINNVPSCVTVVSAVSPFLIVEYDSETLV